MLLSEEIGQEKLHFKPVVCPLTVAYNVTEKFPYKEIDSEFAKTLFALRLRSPFRLLSAFRLRSALRLRSGELDGE